MAGAAETMAAVMCQSSHPGHTGILERTESLDLKKKKKMEIIIMSINMEMNKVQHVHTRTC